MLGVGRIRVEERRLRPGKSCEGSRPSTVRHGVEGRVQLPDSHGPHGTPSQDRRVTLRIRIQRVLEEEAPPIVIGKGDLVNDRGVQLELVPELFGRAEARGASDGLSEVPLEPKLRGPPRVPLALLDEADLVSLQATVVLEAPAQTHPRERARGARVAHEAAGVGTSQAAAPNSPTLHLPSCRLPPKKRLRKLKHAQAAATNEAHEAQLNSVMQDAQKQFWLSDDRLMEILVVGAHLVVA